MHCAFKLGIRLVTLGGRILDTVALQVLSVENFAFHNLEAEFHDPVGFY